MSIGRETGDPPGSPAGYARLLAELKERIASERVRVVLSANASMVLMYWDIGRSILERQAHEGWGAKVVERLAHDLAAAFPEMTGLSSRNLKYMRSFAESWPDREIVQEALARIPWSHNIALLEKLEGRDERIWYASRALAEGWSRNVLVAQISSSLREREGRAQNNFPATLPPADSDLAHQVFKYPYLFDFLGNDVPRREAELEKRLIDHIQSFLIELGRGFAFVGRQVEIAVGDRTFRLDLLFYHLSLRCFVVIELKAGRFEPEYIGKLNMYLNAVDDRLSHGDDKPSIGLLLVQEKDSLIVEYALAGTSKPMGVAQWEREITRSLPEEMKGTLPTAEEIEAELAKPDQGAADD